MPSHQNKKFIPNPIQTFSPQKLQAINPKLPKFVKQRSSRKRNLKRN